ncbi:hypothetical protein BC831DRAFT_452850 [Entophlyctis helioformis]|nr:hypothetical protein BC831DRAFT_452850 [Entophlyctis helioformis]
MVGCDGLAGWECKGRSLQPPLACLAAGRWKLAGPLWGLSPNGRCEASCPAC